MIFNNVYKSKNILITGHTGFKGSWLSLWLHSLGANVIGYSLDPYTEYDNFIETNLSSKIVDIRGDIRDLGKLQEVFNKYQPEFVFHLAAQPLVRLSYEYPKETYETNVMGTLNVLECIRHTPSVKVGVMITTDKCYDNKEQIWGYKEIDPLGGYDPYSSSKGCAEILISSYINSFMNVERFLEHNKAVASARAGNVIGGGDWSKDRIVPDCIRSITDSKCIEIRSPKATRPWQFVLEPLSGYLWLGANLYQYGNKFVGAWNFGPDDDMNIEVKDVVNKIINEYGCGQWKDVSNSYNLHEAQMLKLDCTKAKTYLKWKPVLDSDETFRMTVEWYKNYKNKNMYEFCIKQIEEYENKAKENKLPWI